ncbi:MAG TPA: carboxypeptidase-like regulatory domain-containing protein [Geobacteraceae bacterium]
MKKVLSLIGMAALFSLIGANLAAAANGTITGVVKNIVTGAAIIGATVNDGNKGSTTTDVNGVYTLSEPAGSYTLTTSATGYQTTTQLSTVVAGVATTNNWSLTAAYGNQPIPAANMNYSILAWSDLGMHCDQWDFSYFMLLPPSNNLRVQVFQRGSKSNPVTTGITVSYAFPKKTDSTLHTNWWTFQNQYGFNKPANIGYTGTPMAGTMPVDPANLSFHVTAIPLTPWDDDGTWDPYGTATITVKDLNGNVLQTASVSAPGSTEMNCGNCHGSQTVSIELDILQKHDAHNGTTLAADYANGILHPCNMCHSDNAMIPPAPGQAGVESLSLALHNWHKDKMNYNSVSAATSPDCFNCHPGPQTQCLRGIMARAGKTCHDCHGDLYQMAIDMQNGRQPWLQLPKCSKCHDAVHAENANTLYRNSILNNAPSSSMNGKLYCQGCHSCTHGEYISTLPQDQTIPQQFQGDGYWIWNCTVCHTNKGVQNMHH